MRSIHMGLVVAGCWTRTFQSLHNLDMIQPFAMFAEGIGWLEKAYEILAERWRKNVGACWVGVKSLLNKCHQSNFLTGVVLRFFQPVICCSSVFTGGCNSAESVDLSPKIFKFETFCKRGDPVWQEGCARDHGWFPPNMVSKILESFWRNMGNVWQPNIVLPEIHWIRACGVAVENSFKWVFGSSLSQDS